MKKIFSQLLILLTLLCFVQSSKVFASEHKPGNSGYDTIVNDINKPFSQYEIDRILNIKVVGHNNKNITDLLYLINDEWRGNERKEGLYKQVYRINYLDNNYEYTLLIKNVKIETIKEVKRLYFNLDKRKLIKDIVKEIEEQENISIIKFKLIEDTYSSNYQKEGTYSLKLSVETLTQDNLLLNYEINVEDENSGVQSESKDLTIYIVIGVVILLNGLVIFIFYYNNKKRRGSNEKNY